MRARENLSVFALVPHGYTERLFYRINGMPSSVGSFVRHNPNPNDKYRRYEEYGGGGDADFLWFVENVLSAHNVL